MKTGVAETELIKYKLCVQDVTLNEGGNKHQKKFTCCECLHIHLSHPISPPEQENICKMRLAGMTKTMTQVQFQVALLKPNRRISDWDVQKQSTSYICN